MWKVDTNLLKSRRGGGSRNTEVLYLNLCEYTFKLWFCPKQEKPIGFEILLFLFSLWACYGYNYDKVAARFQLFGLITPLLPNAALLFGGSLRILRAPKA